MTSIFNILKSDHREIASLLGKLDKTTENQEEKRRELFVKFKSLMTTHARSEEKAVYEKLKEKQKMRDLIFESFEEHGLVNHLIAQLSHLSASDEMWAAKLAVLKEMIEHHVEEEEGSLFKKMKSVCTAEELTQMANDMKEFKMSKPFLKPKKPRLSDLMAEARQ